MERSSPPSFRFVASGQFRRLEGALSSLLCLKHQVLDGGDHWLVTARVEAAHRGIKPYRPLVFFQGQYRAIDKSAGAPAPDLVATSDERRRCTIMIEADAALSPARPSLDWQYPLEQLLARLGDLRQRPAAQGAHFAGS